MNTKVRHLRRPAARWFALVFLSCGAASSAFAQTQIVYHSFHSGTFKSAGNGSVVTSVLGQTVYGTSSGNGVTLTSGYSAFGKGSITSVSPLEGIIPSEFALYQNFPNPFNPVTTLQFSVPVRDETTLKVYNIIGQEVAVLFNGIAEPGQFHRVVFDASRLSSGIYFARLQGTNNTQLKKMILLK